MIRESRHYRTRLAVVGSGLAGFAASVFSLQRGIETALVGNTGAIAYTTGYLDLLGWHQDRRVEDPWQALAALRHEQPGHPLGLLSEAEIREAFQLFTTTLGEMGVAYTDPGPRNLLALTPAGTRKPTLCMPRTMVSGIEAIERNAQTLIVDFQGLEGFSGRELVSNLAPVWSNLKTARVAFPGMERGESVFPEVMARALEVPKHREQLAERIKEVLGGATCVGVPAIMGVNQPDRVHSEMQRLSGVPMFEIPTMPPAVPGIRLREMFEQVFPARGLTLVPQQKVKRLELEQKGARLYLNDSFSEVEIESEAVVLATGRFLSGGLVAERTGIREALLGIPVVQPENREGWYRQNYLDPRGHPVNRCGIRIDRAFRPLDSDGRPLSEHLFAAGILLANQDWIRQRCGAGVAVTSAYGAIKSVADRLGCN